VSIRVIVIDDDPSICRLLTYQLGDAGYAVEAFQHAAPALSRLSVAPPDLILLDVMMPGISGWDLCRQIRSSQNTPVIMLTGKQSDSDIAIGLNCGADDYVVKPYSRTQLLARIQAVLRRAPAAVVQPKSTIAHSPVNQPTKKAEPAKPTTTPPAPRPQTTAPPQQSPDRLGSRLAAARRQRGISLHDAERACGVRWGFLQAIEREQFDEIPRNRLAASLRRYSTYLNVDLEPTFHSRWQKHLSASILPLIAVNVVLLLVLLSLLSLLG
jgi:CheY-like chemotaxis protein/transcriptional regulator with XRE-family HTH domain